MVEPTVGGATGAKTIGSSLNLASAVQGDATAED